MSDEPELKSNLDRAIDEMDKSFADLFDAFAHAIGAYWLANKMLAIINWWEARGK